MKPEEEREREEKLEGMLSPKRFRHCLGVAELARRIARDKGVDPERAWTAGLLHDSGKELPPEAKRALLHRRTPQEPDTILEYPALWHAFAGAALAEDQFGIGDAEILHVIRHHPTGHPSFGLLGHALFIADYCEPNQKNPRHEKLADLALRDLEGAVLGVIAMKMEYLFHKKRTIHHDIVDYWNAVVSRKKE